MADTFTLHGVFLSGPTYKAGLTLALCGQTIDYRHVNLAGGEHKSPEFLKLNRYGQVPVLQHRGLTLVMSNVILDYLARTTGHFEAATEQDRWRAREWLAWENDAIVNVARVRHFHRFRKVDPAVMDFFVPGAEAALDMIDRSLAGRQWLVGDHCTIADIGCWGRMVFMAEGSLSLDNRPHARAWRDRLMATPGFALPYDLIPKKDAELPQVA